MVYFWMRFKELLKKIKKYFVQKDNGHRNINYGLLENISLLVYIRQRGELK